MSQLPDSIAAFMAGDRFAVAGVARDGKLPANAILQRFREMGLEVHPVNPNAAEVEGITCYPDVASVPGDVHGVVIATHPKVSAEVVRDCAEAGIRHVWFHRSFGSGSVSKEAVAEAERLGLEAVVGGCPMMFCGDVDLGHRCIRWWLERTGRVPQ